MVQPRQAVAGRPTIAGVGISHPDRVMFPGPRITKLDLARYYDAVGEWMLPHVENRPLTLVHCPRGVPAGGARKGIDCVYMKHDKLWTWGPAELHRVRIREQTKLGNYLVADSAAGLVALAQMDVLEIHTWNSRIAHVERPDRIVIDLDPGSRVRWAQVVAAARLLRKVLEVLELESWVKTTGGRGLHVVVPLEPSADWSACLEFARVLASTLVRREPIFTMRFARTGRDERILIDYLRNNRTNTSIAAYSTRARPEAPVSMPVTWRALAASEPAQFTVPAVLERLARRRRDPWADYWRSRQRISRYAIPALERL